MSRSTAAPGLDPEIDQIRSLARPLRSPDDLDPLLERVGDARFVLVGEASHGTSDYYGWRAALTRRLVVEKRFSLVAVEGDWPDCAEVDRWIRGEPPGRDGPPPPDARSLLAGFDRWPTWMWANEEVADHHMADTLDRLVAHHGPGANVVVWEHNTHVGDARATDMSRAGMVNVGQLVRERHAADGVVLVGFGGHRGHVVAADFWGGPFRAVAVPPIGRRYDAFISLEETRALHPLHTEVPRAGTELETYPWST